MQQLFYQLKVRIGVDIVRLDANDNLPSGIIEIIIHINNQVVGIRVTESDNEDIVEKIGALFDRYYPIKKD